MHKRFLTLLTIVLFLSGCSDPTPESMLRDYAQRVSNAIEFEVEFNPSEATYPAFPPRRERLLPITELREGLIDVLQFRHCDLLPLIAERNSNLGRVMPPSQTLKYELRFLPAIQQCEQRLTEQVEHDEEMASLLERVIEIRQHKEQQLPSILWNSLYTASEMEQQFARSASPLSLTSSDRINQIQQTLDPFIVFTELAENPTRQLEPEFIDAIEDYYERLYRTELGSEWLQSVSLLTESMNAVASAIDKRLEARSICYNQQPNNRATIIQNVFRNFYAAEFQPYLAKTDQLGQRWRSIHLHMLQNLPVPDSSASYFASIFETTDKKGFMKAYEDAKQRHIASWQRLLDHCGLMAGKN